MKNPSAERIDEIVSGEIPDINTDPDGYNAVNNFMMHGPCGELHKNCSCMLKDQCTKYFPKKKFNDQTTIDSDGFPVYKRRKTSIYIEKKGVLLDNSFVVPYNKNMMVKFDAYIYILRYAIIQDPSNIYSSTLIKDLIEQRRPWKPLTPFEK